MIIKCPTSPLKHEGKLSLSLLLVVKVLYVGEAEHPLINGFVLRKY